MAIDEADQPDADGASTGEASASGSGDAGSHESDAGSGSGVRVGEYTWADFMEEYGYGDEAKTVYSGLERDEKSTDQLGLDTDEEPEAVVPTDTDFADVSFDPEPYLGYTPDDLHDRVIPMAGSNYDALEEPFLEYVDPETTPVVKDVWTWEHYKWEYYYEDDGSRPRDSDGEIVRHDEEDALGFDPDTLEDRLSIADDIAMELDDVIEERTVNIQDDIDEDEFFSTADGNTTVSNRYDLEKTVPMEKKTHYRELERYWVNKPYAYVVIFHSEKENEKKYYMIEPHLNEIELELQDFLSGKLRKAIKYSDDGVKEKADEDGRRIVIEDETRQLLKRYDLFEKTSGSNKAGIIETIQTLLDDEDEADEDDGPAQLEGIEVRPEPIILAEDPDTLNEYQVEKLLYFLKRNFIGYERIDGIKHDINVEDISVDGYNSPVFVYHSEYEQIISNIYHGEDELDDFVVKLAQRSGKGISKRLPQVDATLPDGSRAQLTLGQEVSDHGTNYTIRQFKDVPFTPIDLINWNTFSLDEMAFLWLAIENHKSLIFAGGTASGKTTSLNAVSLFIPSSAKIVSIEDTREVELPQRNWIASVTRPSFADDEQGDVDEFDLLEAALRQRPDYIVMGEIRGEEGRTLFQVMSTGHTTYTTFHADSVDEVLKRFTTDPINVSKTMFTALDLVSIQTQTRVQGRKVRRNKSLTEINHYEAEHDEINVQDVYQWQAETDEFLKMGDSNTLEEIQFDRGWSTEKLENELFKREVILAYLIKNGLNTYAEVAATVQAFINDPDTILTLIANGQLEESLEDLREMESVLIDVDQEKEELVPRPDATSETYNLSMDLLERAEESLFEEYRGKVPSGLASALGEVESEDTVEADTGADEFDFSGDIDDGLADEWTFGDGPTAFETAAGSGATTATATATATAAADDEPDWFAESDDSGFGIEATAAETGPNAGPAPDSASTDDTAPAAATTSSSGVDSMDSSGGETATSTDTDPVTETKTETDVLDTVDTDDFGSGEPPAWSVDEPTDDTDGPFSGSGSGPTGGSMSADGTATDAADDITVFPSDEADDGDLGGLFDDMGETLDELESATEASSDQPVETDSERTSTADGDAMFSGDELEDVFDPDPDPDPEPGPEQGPEPESEQESVPSSGEAGGGNEGEGEGDGEGGANTDTDQPDGDVISFDESEIDSADETAVTPEQQETDDGGDSGGDSDDGDDESRSIFGDQSETVFGDADSTADGEQEAPQPESEDGSLFDDAEPGPKSSIFADESETDDADDAGSTVDAGGGESKAGNDESDGGEHETTENTTSTNSNSTETDE
ncbi:type II/IV secretion system ATPase protein [Natrialba magadii ATCC 43099]|uniref:Type II secretion system protein E n=1 Tax=Natrialba magadii (strain ATCC 43099 / DSM 3394 / CCM 3739 / CIP 104546 / IAM 13178 / JCM 8861 / NBRC 102185 / NCIMB 2190 / MS3) TaxID=547559 RepID=D3SRR5_NATMM|nr:type II/IV secretion system ATPase subunit [Natrialba magadii]ADD06689.1 type II/IV secretion system ATPase protein [Natrialba magadii ATCC 43099]ELY31850.1 type II secretion system protein E [Natrialba magadii ATCC 43099]